MQGFFFNMQDLSKGAKMRLWTGNLSNQENFHFLSRKFLLFQSDCQLLILLELELVWRSYLNENKYSRKHL